MSVKGLKVDPTSLFDLSDQGFLVVGAGGGGLGSESARLLAAQGAKVMCVDIDKDLAEEIAQECGGVPYVTDVTDEQNVIEMLDATEKEFGRIHGLVDIVGYSTMSNAAEITVEEWDNEFNRNLRHAFLLGRNLGPRQAAAGGGCMTFFSSVASLYGMSVAPAYTASKAALNGWMRSLAQQFGPDGVRVNCVLPGATWSPRNRERWSAETIANQERASMMKKVGEEYHIAAAVLYLSSKAAGNTTAHTLVVDGGATQMDPYFARS